MIKVKKNILDKMQSYYLIVLLSLPVILENFFQILLGSVDMYFAGSIDDNAIAAIGITTLIVNVVLAFYTAISVGTTAVMTRRVGEKRPEEIKKTVMQSINISLVLGLIIGLIAIASNRTFLEWLGANDNVISCALPYYNIIVIPSVLICLTTVSASCLRALKDTKTPMLITLFANILNIVLNVIFMKLGYNIIGLAYATTISRLASTILLLYILNKKLLKEYKLRLFNNWSLNLENCFSILKIGLPSGLEKLVMRLGQLIYNNLIIIIGINAFVAHSIGGTIESYTYVFGVGFGIAAANLVGIALGERDKKYAQKVVKDSFQITLVLMTIAGIVLFVFAPQLVSLFTKTPEIANLVITIIRIIACFQPFAAMSQIYSNALQGAGDTKFPLYATIIGMWVCRIGIGYFLADSFSLGLIGIWLGYALDLVVRGIVLWIRFRKGKWQTIEI